MKLIKITVILFSIFAFGINSAQAQNKKLDKETRKQLREFMKNPASYRRIEKNNQRSLDSAELKLAVIEERYDQLRVLNRIYYDSIQKLNAKIRDLELMENTIKNTIAESLDLEYRVQIGAYALNDFNGAAGLGTAIKTETVDGVTKYYAGSFSDPFEAEEFAEAIRVMGIQGAFVVKFVEGDRIPFDFKDLMAE